MQFQDELNHLNPLLDLSTDFTNMSILSQDNKIVRYYKPEQIVYQKTVMFRRYFIKGSALEFWVLCSIE